jgi:hypothetical protein
MLLSAGGAVVLGYLAITNYNSLEYSREDGEWLANTSSMPANRNTTM